MSLGTAATYAIAGPPATTKRRGPGAGACLSSLLLRRRRRRSAPTHARAAGPSCGGRGRGRGKGRRSPPPRGCAFSWRWRGSWRRSGGGRGGWSATSRATACAGRATASSSAAPSSSSGSWSTPPPAPRRPTRPTTCSPGCSPSTTIGGSSTVTHWQHRDGCFNSFDSLHCHLPISLFRPSHLLRGLDHKPIIKQTHHSLIDTLLCHHAVSWCIHTF